MHLHTRGARIVLDGPVNLQLGARLYGNGIVFAVEAVVHSVCHQVILDGAGCCCRFVYIGAAAVRCSRSCRRCGVVARCRSRLAADLDNETMEVERGIRILILERANNVRFAAVLQRNLIAAGFCRHGKGEGRNNSAVLGSQNLILTKDVCICFFIPLNRRLISLACLAPCELETAEIEMHLHSGGTRIVLDLPCDRKGISSVSDGRDLVNVLTGTRVEGGAVLHDHIECHVGISCHNGHGIHRVRECRNQCGCCETQGRQRGNESLHLVPFLDYVRRAQVPAHITPSSYLTLIVRHAIIIVYIIVYRTLRIGFYWIICRGLPA